MGKFFKFIFSLFGLLATAVGVLAVVDKITNKNRIEGDYLNCNKPEDDSSEDSE